jgi:hypothetical protein
LKEINTENKRRLEDMKREIASDRAASEAKLAKQMEILQQQMVELMGQPTGQPLSPIRKRLDTKETPTKNDFTMYPTTGMLPPGGYAPTLHPPFYGNFAHPPPGPPYPPAPPYHQLPNHQYMDQENQPPMEQYHPPFQYNYRSDLQHHYHPHVQNHKDPANQEVPHSTAGSSLDQNAPQC